MFEFENQPPKVNDRPDYSGLIIGTMLLPLFFLFVYMGRAELGFSACIVLAMIMVAIRMRWKLRKHLWFWATIALVLALHVPLFFIIHWQDTKIPTIVYSMPLGIADYLIILGAIGLAEKIFSKDSLTEDNQE